MLNLRNARQGSCFAGLIGRRVGDHVRRALRNRAVRNSGGGAGGGGEGADRAGGCKGVGLAGAPEDCAKELLLGLMLPTLRQLSDVSMEGGVQLQIETGMCCTVLYHP